MRFETIKGITHIYVEDGETEQQVLRAIAKTSFKSALPAGPFGQKKFNPEDVMTDEMADNYINLQGDEVLLLDFAKGRRCKTSLMRVEKGHFKLNNIMFEQDRGNPIQLLKEVQSMLGPA